MFTQIWIIVLSAVVVGLFVVTRTQNKTNQRLKKEKLEYEQTNQRLKKEKLEYEQKIKELEGQLSGGRIITDACYVCKNVIKTYNGFTSGAACILNAKCKDFQKN